MPRTISALCLACGLTAVTSALAAGPGLKVCMTESSGSTVKVIVQNPSGTTQTGRVTVTVPLANGGFATLTSDNLTLEPKATTEITLTTPAPVKIIDDPEPIGT